MPDMNERDPYGADPRRGGAKFDAGKIKPRLVITSFALALKAVARVGTDGAEKYTADGWADVPDGVARYTDAMLRHFLDEHEGFDRMSGSRHAAHVAWNALARLELMLREEQAARLAFERAEALSALSGTGAPSSLRSNPWPEPEGAPAASSTDARR